MIVFNVGKKGILYKTLSASVFMQVLTENLLQYKSSKNKKLLSAYHQLDAIPSTNQALCKITTVNKLVFNDVI